jgi:hypothetical protein
LQASGAQSGVEKKGRARVSGMRGEEKPGRKALILSCHTAVRATMRLKMKYIALGALLVSILALGWGIETTRASIDYWMDTPQAFSKGLNTITIYCKNGGGTDGNFYLDLRFVNASFSNQTLQPYSRTDDSTTRFPFLLHKGESYQKSVYFLVNETESFSLQLSYAKMSSFDVSKSNPLYATALEYEWNQQTVDFQCIKAT